MPIKIIARKKHSSDQHFAKMTLDNIVNAVQEVIDEGDEKLKNMKNDYGDDEVSEAVTTALMEMKEYSPSGRYIVPELWNFKEGRQH